MTYCLGIPRRTGKGSRTEKGKKPGKAAISGKVLLRIANLPKSLRWESLAAKACFSWERCPKEVKEIWENLGGALAVPTPQHFLENFFVKHFKVKKRQSLLYKPVINEKIVFSAWDLTLGLWIKLWSYNKKWELEHGDDATDGCASTQKSKVWMRKWHFDVKRGNKN